jgi:hypothetical protein
VRCCGLAHDFLLMNRRRATTGIQDSGWRGSRPELTHWICASVVAAVAGGICRTVALITSDRTPPSSGAQHAFETNFASPRSLSMKIIAIRWLQRFQQSAVSLHQESAWVHMLLAILPQAEQSGLKTLGIRGVRRYSHICGHQSRRWKYLSTNSRSRPGICLSAGAAYYLATNALWPRFTSHS